MLIKGDPPTENMFGCEINVECKVALKTYHGTYVVAETNGDANSNSDLIGSQEIFIVTFVDSDTVTFKSFENHTLQHLFVAYSSKRHFKLFNSHIGLSLI